MGAPHGAYGVLQSAGLLFFAFAGYARIATLGEEVREPARVIPRAIVAALLVAVVVYAVVGVAVLSVLGPDATGASSEPLADAVARRRLGLGGAGRPGRAALAAAGALLALVAGLGRTSLAMAREGDLPALVGRRAPALPGPASRGAERRRRRGRPGAGRRPARGDRLLVVRGAALLLRRQRAAHAQGPEHRRFPRWLQLVGCAGCVVLVVTLPWQAVGAGVAVFVVGVLVRVVRLRS